MRSVVLIALCVVSCLGTLIARAPAAAVLEFFDLRQTGVTYAEARGTIWNSLLTDVRANGRAVGDIALRIDPLALLLGRGRAHIQLAGAGLRGAGQVEAGLGGQLTLRNAQMVMDIRHVEALHDLVRARGGEVLVRVDRLVVDRNGCREAAGLVVTDVLARPDGRTTWRGPELQGAPECRGSTLALVLQGRDESGAIRVEASVSPDGSAGFTADVETDNTDFLVAANLFGFRNINGVYTYSRQVRFLDLTG